MFRKSLSGFTLLEILIALFVFTMISMIMASALHTVMTNQTRTEKNAARFEALQLAIVLLARDFNGTIDRSILTKDHAEESAVIGKNNRVTLTTSGVINPLNQLQRSTLQRIQYELKEGTLIRTTWNALDQTQYTNMSTSKLLTSVQTLSFEYLDQQGHFQNQWPSIDATDNKELPRAVRIVITLNDLGKISQLYVIPGQKIEATASKTT